MPRQGRLNGWAGVLAGLSAWLTWPVLAGADPPAPVRIAGPADVTVFQQALFDCIDAAAPAVVAISRVPASPPSDPTSAPLDPFGLNLQNQLGQPAPSDRTELDFLPSGFGTGVLVQLPGAVAERLILTNLHVVRGGPVAGEPIDPDGERLHVHLPGGLGTTATIVAADPRSDLAMLRLDPQPGLELARLQPIRMAAPQSNPRRGQLVVVLGNPYAVARDGAASASLGMISNVSRYPAAEGARTAPDKSIHYLGTLLTVDARLSLGTSGGALVNLEGELVGLTTSLAALQGYEKSVGYAIPLDAAMQRVIRDLARGLEVDHAYLGIEPRNALPNEVETLRQNAETFDRPSAVLVRMVTQDSPAAQGGLRNDDVILSINDRPIGTFVDVHREVGLLEAGSRARVRILRIREGEPRELNLAVELGKWPVEDSRSLVATRPRYEPWRGITVDFPTARRKWILDPYRYPRAVVVKDVTSPAVEATGLASGDFVAAVNGTPVQSPREFYEVARGLSGEVTLQMLDGTTRTIPP